MSNSDAVIQMKLIVSLLLGIAWTDSDLHLASENNTIFQKWAVLLHAWGLVRRHFGLLGLPPLHTRRTSSVQHVYITMSCLRRSHLKDEAHTVIRRHKFNKSFTVRFPGRITEKAGFSPILIWTSFGV
jgi:hypothetical protein